ncbi:hypothetical protein MKY59_20245 [Paenibacillus sp. FSL W8-0426]|uniref:hypothetical protein n=1 Tax=Paenibacillus sp. FSL W8-0426 TaxID=2921714 RepID=UPI0030DB6B47
MALWSWWINMIGILISLAGSIYAYKGAARDTIGLDDRSSFPLTNQQKEELFKGFSNRRKFSKHGFFLLIVGFVLLGIAQLFVYPS